MFKIVSNNRGLGKSLSTKPSMPPTESDKKLSIAHHKDSIAFNIRHATEHIKKANIHIKDLQRLKKK